MKNSSQHILKGILLSAIASMIGNSVNAKGNPQNINRQDDDDFGELENSSNRIYKNVLKMSPSGNVTFVNTHRSHSSHSSHRSGSYVRSHSSHTSHTSHSSSSSGYSVPSRSTSVRATTSTTSSRTAGYGTGTSNSSSRGTGTISGLYSTSNSNVVNYKTIELGERNLKMDLYGNDVNKLVKLLDEKLYIRERWVSKKDGFLLFDTQVEEAIKHFQKDAKLEQSGQIDKTTLQMLKTWDKEKTTVLLGVRDLFYTENLTMSGNDVDELVTLLWAKGLVPSPSTIAKKNGHAIFSRDIEMAVKLYQKYNNMSETGTVDEIFVKSLKGFSTNSSYHERNADTNVETDFLNTSFPEDSDDRILDVPEESAEFPGDVYAWLNKNMQYPEICKENNVQGRVSVQFVINKDGTITDVKALRSPDSNLSNEAIRLVLSMPKWKPARQGNKPVRMRYLLPVMFRL